ncbi:MAG: DUF4274 domain-containing protein [Planctomycetaceae bacterium]|nr:DUF4274 domain-containing protein [Planctomycetaceae bacterium]
MPISKRRQQEILNLATPGVPPNTPEEFWNDDAALKPLIRDADRRRKVWLSTATDPKELHLFAENWHWDGGGGKQLQPLVGNRHCDAGTLLMLFWYGGGEDSYFQYNRLTDIESEFDREVHRLLLKIEKRLAKNDYVTANIYFDPSSFASMHDRRDEFARPVPDFMYQPIGRKPRNTNRG